MSDAYFSSRSGDAVPAALSEGLAALQSSLDRLTAATEREHERASHREKIIDRLHDDNQELRRGELQAMLDPIRTSLYRLHDMVRRESRRWAEDAGDPAHVGPLLSAIADEIAEALARAGAERYTVEPGEPFDQAVHKPVETVAVSDPALDGTVVAARGDGFRRGEQILRRAEVVIGKAAEALAARPNASAESI
ncbi:MAG TPA: nucleotide exchange factor GrpE [Streptosporangiaceae bacterium]|nr:nucleotide exchange factor GrpE [Streptosporangiaceae bacterium]